jgi:alpha-L-arabinofuranosidase
MSSVVYAMAAAVICALGLMGAARAQTAPLAGYWRFDEGTGKTAQDTSGSGAPATLTGDAIWTSDGTRGAAALRVGGAGYADIPAATVDTSRSFTVAAWVRLANTTGTQTFASIDGTSVSGFFLQSRNNGAFSFALFPSDAPQGQVAATATWVCEPHTWYYLVGVYDSVTRSISLYVDGVLQDTEPFDSPWRAAGHTVVGRGEYAGRQSYFATADIEDVRFYSGVHADTTELAQVAEETHARDVNLHVNATLLGAPISPQLYGVMLEEINHGIDGGLYAELIRNRSFKDDPQNPVHWSVIPENGAGTLALDQNQQISGTALTTSLRMDVAQASSDHPVGVSNEGYWGISVLPKTRYEASFYAKVAAGYSGPLTVAIESVDGGTTFAKAQVDHVTQDWKQYHITLQTGGDFAPSTTNCFVISVQGPGTLWLNQVSLFPPTYNGRLNGTRIDLSDRINELHPTFLRMPGGNVVEGRDMGDRYNWKQTIGTIDQRPGHVSSWGYRSDDGFGLLEYLEWCEDLGMEPILTVFAGYTLDGKHVAPGADLAPYVQDALDEIEYVTGSPATKYGAMRVADGHPKPFPLHYVEIGNEDFFDKSGSYEDRFAQFFDAIRGQYADLKIISTSLVKSRRPDIIDAHFRLPAKQFERDWRHYDSYDRQNPLVFIGEYASQGEVPSSQDPESHGPMPDLDMAMGDACWMIGMERNADIVTMAAYAPLLVNMNPGARQWALSLLGFDGLHSCASPSYYVQAVFRRYLGDHVVPSTLSGISGMAWVVSKRTDTGDMFIKVVNPSSSSVSTGIYLDGADRINSHGTAWVLTSASGADVNTPDNPSNVTPAISQVGGIGAHFQYTFLPRSVTVLVISPLH